MDASKQILESDEANRIIAMVDDVQNKEKLIESLKRIQYLASPYAYELIRFLFVLISRLTPGDLIAKKAFAILSILGNYERKSDVSEAEMHAVVSRIDMTDCSTLEVYKTHFPQCSHRLPYHELIYDTINVLTTEMDEENLTILLPLSGPLERSPDEIYMIVVTKFIMRLVYTTSSILS
jgi:hypothetical protein